jgi:hypothetical protein
MTTEPLAVADDLANQERVIESGLQTFIEVGQALLTIRDKRLYKDTYASFDAYCQERWGWTRQRAHQLIQGAEVSNMLDAPPANARQAAELAPLRDDPDAMRELWAEVREAHGDDLTAADVRSAVKEYLGDTPEIEEAESEPPAEPLAGELEPARPQFLEDFRTALKDAPLYGLLCYKPQDLLPDVVFYGDGDVIRAGLANVRAWLDEWTQALGS